MLKFGLRLRHPHPQEAVQKPLGEMASPEIAAAWRKAEFSILPGQTSWWETKKKKKKTHPEMDISGEKPCLAFIVHAGSKPTFSRWQFITGCGLFG